MGKRIGILIAFLCGAFLTPVHAQYVTPTPGSCTGIADCTSTVICNSACGECGANITVVCSGGQKCTDSCGTSTSCYNSSGGLCSTPPTGCPSDRSGCTWSAANDCGGGTCGCGQRRTSSEFCNGYHCDDACSADATCATNCNGVTPTPGPTSPPGPTIAPDNCTY